MRAVYSAIAALVVMVAHPGTFEHVRWLAYTSLVCAQAVRANANRSIREPIHRLPMNWFLLTAGIAVVAIQAAIPYVPFLASAFHATPLDLTDWGIVVVIAIIPALVAETGANRHRQDLDRRDVRDILSRDEPVHRPRHEAVRDDARPRPADVRGRRAARCSASSARTARARPRRCASASGSSARTPARSAGTARPTAELPRRTWGYLPEERGLYPRMTVLDQLVYFASLYGEPPDRARREALAWLRRFRIPEYADRRAEELSKGNQQKVQFIAAILHDPEVLLMDEPFTGLDPVNLILLREAFMELRDRGRTLIFSTHQMEAAEALCESVAIVDHGRLVAGGTVCATSSARAAGGRVRLAVDGELRHRLAGGPARGRGRPPRRRTARSSSCCPGPIRPRSSRRSSRRGVSIRRFEVAEPSLEALFIEHVGRPADDDERSRPSVVGAAAARRPGRRA